MLNRWRLYSTLTTNFVTLDPNSTGSWLLCYLLLSRNTLSPSPINRSESHSPAPRPANFLLNLAIFLDWLILSGIWGWGFTMADHLTAVTDWLMGHLTTGALISACFFIGLLFDKRWRRYVPKKKRTARFYNPEDRLFIVTHVRTAKSDTVCYTDYTEWRNVQWKDSCFVLFCGDVAYTAFSGRTADEWWTGKEAVVA
jgi:hypothetical protein